MAGAQSSSLVLLGRIAGAHGIRGEVLVKSFTAVPKDIGAYGPLTDRKGARSFNVESARPTSKGVVVRLQGVSDRNAAEALKGTELFIERDRLPPASGDEFYHADLIGMAAVDPAGEPIGEIVAVRNFGAGDLLEVRLAGTSKSELLPFTDAFVPEVDIAGRRVIIVQPPLDES